MTLDALQIQAILPHRYPFLLIDRVLEVVANERVLARKLVSMSDPILQGHFPGFPVMPGVLQVEAMAQAAVVLAHVSGHFDPAIHNCLFVGIQEAKFRAPVVPGDVLDIEVVAQRLGRLGKFSGEIRCDGKVRSSAIFTAIVEPKRADG
ncbi:MAG TPA: 3-hydroxyacyl-ACP dehydratase FabZ [Nannocystaceae bacterium]|nr:3-hydroxyacyl-ACP dehydratase FabZ [Nannocystaceae bacterium]